MGVFLVGSAGPPASGRRGGLSSCGWRGFRPRGGPAGRLAARPGRDLIVGEGRESFARADGRTKCDAAVSRNTKLAIGDDPGRERRWPWSRGWCSRRVRHDPGRASAVVQRSTSNFTGVRKVLVRTDARPSRSSRWGRQHVRQPRLADRRGDPGGPRLIKIRTGGLNCVGTLGATRTNISASMRSSSISMWSSRPIRWCRRSISRNRRPREEVRHDDEVYARSADRQHAHRCADAGDSDRRALVRPWHRRSPVLASVERTLANQETAIRKVIADNIGRRAVFSAAVAKSGN